MDSSKLDHAADIQDPEAGGIVKELDERVDVEHLAIREPFGLFNCWFNEINRLHTKEARTFTLATATKDGLPSCRPLILVDIINGKGFTFFTDYDSRKGRELEENPHAAMSFWWSCTAKSIRIEGRVEKLSNAESDAYFFSIPLEYKIAAVVNAECEQVIPNLQVNQIRLLYLIGEKA